LICQRLAGAVCDDENIDDGDAIVAAVVRDDENIDDDDDYCDRNLLLFVIVIVAAAVLCLFLFLFYYCMYRTNCMMID